MSQSAMVELTKLCIITCTKMHKISNSLDFWIETLWTILPFEQCSTERPTV